MEFSSVFSEESDSHPQHDYTWVYRVLVWKYIIDLAPTERIVLVQGTSSNLSKIIYKILI